MVFSRYQKKLIINWKLTVYSVDITTLNGNASLKSNPCEIRNHLILYKWTIAFIGNHRKVVHMVSTSDLQNVAFGVSGVTEWRGVGGAWGTVGGAHERCTVSDHWSGGERREAWRRWSESREHGARERATGTSPTNERCRRVPRSIWRTPALLQLISDRQPQQQSERRRVATRSSHHPATGGPSTDYLIALFPSDAHRRPNIPANGQMRANIILHLCFYTDWQKHIID